MEIRAFGLLVNDPRRTHYAMHTLEKYFTLSPNIDGYGVATCANNSVLLTRAPGKLDKVPLAHLVGPLNGPCALGQFRRKNDIRPFKSSMLSANLGPYRYKDIAGVVIGGAENPDTLNADREKLLNLLPDNLSRMVTGMTEGEVFFYAIVSKLGPDFHTLVCAEKAQRCKAAIEQILSVISPSSERAVMVAFADEVVIFNHQMELSCVSLRSLDKDLLDKQWDKSLHFPNATKSELERFSGVCAFIGGGKSLAQKPKSKSLTVRSFQNNQFLWLNSDMGVSPI